MSGMRKGSSPLARGLPRLGVRLGLRIGIIPARAGFTGICSLIFPSHCGSSPLARGLPSGPIPPDEGKGIIPARAGFTQQPGRSWSRCPDHPRSRGVYWKVAPGRGISPGSSPLARGLLDRIPEPGHHRGIIPARAGFTRPRRCRSCGPPDHPRSRGVYAFCRSMWAVIFGSSPLARGLPVPRVAGVQEPRIIPARAGFTRRRSRRFSSRRDHPRSRGVYSASTVALPLSLGSSPLARGLRGAAQTKLADTRIIPARAGFTRVSRACARSCRDHPRSRGVYAIRSSRRCCCLGSSPLARGLLPEVPAARQVLRIIPARAGFTLRQGRSRRPRTDHPRSRGVYSRLVNRSVMERGSSPLARGLQREEHYQLRLERIIPARAGFTTTKR